MEVVVCGLVLQVTVQSDPLVYALKPKTKKSCHFIEVELPPTEEGATTKLPPTEEGATSKSLKLERFKSRVAHLPGPPAICVRASFSVPFKFKIDSNIDLASEKPALYKICYMLYVIEGRDTQPNQTCSDGYTFSVAICHRGVSLYLYLRSIKY